MSNKRFKRDPKQDFPQLDLTSPTTFIKNANLMGVVSGKRRFFIHPSSLNNEQKKVYSYVETCLNEGKVFRIIAPGAAGVGKSFLISALRPLFERKGLRCQVLSFTGSSAFNVGDKSTFHRFFNIPFKGGYKSPCNMSDFLRRRLAEFHVFIFDEFSLIGLNLMGFVSVRLMDVFESTEVFGNKSVILFGDHSQLRPVIDRPLHVNLALLKDPNPIEMKGKEAYEAFKTVFFLRTIMRQKAESENRFRELLGRIRIGKITVDDVSILESRNCKNLTKEEISEFCEKGIMVFAERAPAMAYNEFRLKQLGTEIIEIVSIDSGHNAPSSPHILRLAVGARVQVTRNLFVKAGIFNGSLGRVVEISTERDEENFPQYILVKLDEYVGPLFNGSPNIPFVPVLYPESSRSTATTWTRKNFSLQLSFGVTAHRCQGLTLDKVIIGLPCNKFSMFYSAAPSLFYTAISRVRSLNDVSFSVPFDEKVVNNSSKHHIEWQLEEERLKLLENK